MSSTAPPRITPFYDVPQNLEGTELMPSEAAELQQGGKTFTGTVRVVQQWAPMFAYIEFMTPSAKEIKAADEAHVKSAKVDTDISVEVLMANGIRGTWSGGLDIGTDHKLDQVTFHLPNYPDLYGRTNRTGNALLIQPRRERSFLRHVHGAYGHDDRPRIAC